MVNNHSYKIILILTLILSLILAINTVIASDITLSNIQIVKTEVTPEPVEPGNDIVLKVMIINSGNTMAENINIIPDVSYPMYFKKSDFNKVDFSICGGCSYEATYYIVVDSNTKSGIYPINFDILYENNKIKEETVLVKVIGVPDILLNYEKEESHYPGDNFELNLLLNNIGTGNAKNIKITSLSEDFLLTGSQTKYLDFLNSSENKEIKLNFAVNSEVISGLYKIPFEIVYLDELGNELKKNYEVSINILDSASISLQNLKIKNYETTIFEEIVIEAIIENNGDGRAENVYAYIETDLDGYEKSFVGSLNSGEDSPILFKLKSSKSGIYPIKLIVNYEDDMGVHILEEIIEVKVVKPTSKLYTLIGVLVIIIVIFTVRHFFFKRKNEKN